MDYNRSIGITITRALISLLLIKDFISYILYYDVFFAQHAIVPYSFYEKLLSFYGLSFLVIDFNNPTITLCLLFTGLLSSLLLFMGNYKVVAGALLFFVLIELKFRNIYLLDGGDNVISATLPFLALSYSRPFLELPSLKVGYRINAIRRLIQILAGKALMIQFAFVYLFAALDKFMNLVWRNGEALYYALRLKDFMATDLNVVLTKNGALVKLLTYFTLVWESAFPFLIWFKNTKKYIVAISVAMHFGILILMRIDSYSILMVSFYPIYFSNHEISSFVTRFKQRFNRLYSIFKKFSFFRKV